MKNTNWNDPNFQGFGRQPRPKKERKAVGTPLGRTALNDVIHPLTGEVLCKAGEEITESIAEAIEKSPLESVEIRSVLTCESRRGVCAKC